MKYLLLVALVSFSFSSMAEYHCQGAKGTSLESFKIYELSKTQLETSLDGTLDTAEESQDKKTIEYIYNNGCDNDITLRISKAALDYLPEVFNLRMDYLTADEILTDTEVVCFKLSAK